MMYKIRCPYCGFDIEAKDPVLEQITCSKYCADMVWNAICEKYGFLLRSKRQRKIGRRIQLQKYLLEYFQGETQEPPGMSGA